MLSFFKKKDKKIERSGEDSTVSSNELLENGADASSSKEVDTKLSYHPSWNLKEEEKYVYQFLHNQLPKLVENQISISGIEIKVVDNKLMVSAFVRNTLSRPVKFQEMPLLLLGANGELIGRKIFDLSVLGELPPTSSRPWHFFFEKNEVTTLDIPASGWKLAFELKKKHSLDLAESWENSLSDTDKEKLQQLINTVEPPKPGEVNFMGLQAKQSEDGNLHVTMLIRNGSTKNINLQQIPLVIEDASGDIVAKGGFQLTDFEVKANTSKPWTFIFPKELIVKEDIDLSKWKAYPPQEQK
ncbi:accessory Sec system S-layer assembly protein [Bacillus salitolerans]|uniref:Accessory Sec system S-layer assembly protein n=1 Tax=Bacillus salitolerans TaxID=1437434 RepID=A0ABW4LPM1_9BACI